MINGDFLDFAQAPPWQGNDLESLSRDAQLPLCFTEEQSCIKLAAIMAAHPSFVASLNGFLAARPENRLTILPGNHDADFFFPEVRRHLRYGVSSDERISDRISFNLDQVYHPTAAIWIEHGHQHDPCNSFFIEGRARWSSVTPPIFDDQEGKPRLYECVGTRFLIKFLNQLDRDYPFVDNVKPFSIFLRLFAASALVPGFGPLKATVAAWSMLHYIASTVTHNRSDLLGLGESKGPTSPERVLLEAMARISPQDRRAFERNIRSRGFNLGDASWLLEPERAGSLLRPEGVSSLFEFLSNNLDLLDLFPARDSSSYLSAGTPGTLTLARGFSFDETRELKREAHRLLAHTGGPCCVVMGHTHDPVAGIPEGVYLNTGSWTRYYRGESNTPQPWSILTSGSYQHFPYQLNYAEMELGMPKSARLVTFREG